MRTYIYFCSIFLKHEKNQYFPIHAPYHPIESIKIRMEEINMKEKYLVGIIEGKSRVIKILNEKRKLALEMIQKLSTKLHIPIEVLIQDY